MKQLNFICFENLTLYEFNINEYEHLKKQPESGPQIEPKGANLTCVDCYTLTSASVVWILIGFLIGGLVFGVLCYFMGNTCCSTSQTKVDNSPVDSVTPMSVAPPSSSEPTSQIPTSVSYGMFWEFFVIF